MSDDRELYEIALIGGPLAGKIVGLDDRYRMLGPRGEDRLAMPVYKKIEVSVVRRGAYIRPEPMADIAMYKRMCLFNPPEPERPTFIWIHDDMTLEQGVAELVDFYTASRKEIK